MTRAAALALAFVAIVSACDGDETTAPNVPTDVRNAPTTAVIAGVPVGITGFAYREFTAAGAVVGDTKWLARAVSPPGTTLPVFTAVELWYVIGSTGARVEIASTELVTDGTDQYFDIRGQDGKVNPGATVDIVVKLRDEAGGLFLIRTANVPVQRSERLE